ncbi:MAG: hypothetical protein M3416_17695 [Acidobacteriota bacterium]|nr:hypothetical protein [Acidobacteriota bacterium]
MPEDEETGKAGAGEGGSGEKAGGGETTPVERVLNRWVGDAIHLFLSLLSVFILAAATVAAYDTAVTEFPKLLVPVDEYDVLQKIIQNILLIAIAAELGLLLLFHRTSSAIEVIIFVIARKIVSPEISSLDLLLSVAALCGLLVARFYFLPGKPK